MRLRRRMRNLRDHPVWPLSFSLLHLIKIWADDIALPILAYCIASIMMTVVNKFVVSGSQFTMTFLRESQMEHSEALLTDQS